MPTQPVPVEPRRIIEREIRLLKVLGSGSFGEVHLAVPAKDARKASFTYPPRMAVKILHKHLCTPDQLDALLKELEALRRLQHPCIVNYVGVWREASSRSKYQGSYCLAMQYCDGGEVDALLRDAVRRKCLLPQDVVVRLMVCVFAGLNYSHTHRIIHRDIKPANVFLMKADGAATGPAAPGADVAKALIGDYGLARPLDKTMQLVKTRVGTPCYCSPEIVTGEDYTSKTDIFSAGVMFYELMAQESPFWKKSFTDIQCFAAIVNHDPLPRLRQLCVEHYGRSLVEIVCRCLSKHELQRPSAYEVLTSFSARLRRAVTDLRLPVYADRVSDAASGSVQGRPEPATAARGSPHREEAPLKVELQPEPLPGPTARLLQRMRAEFATPQDAALMKALNGNVESFLLLKVLMVTRGGADTRADAGVVAVAASHERDARSVACNLLLGLGCGWRPEDANLIADIVGTACAP